MRVVEQRTRIVDFGEVRDMERDREKERVLVPVRRRQVETRKTLPQKPPAPPLTADVWEMPRRWHVY